MKKQEEKTKEELKQEKKLEKKKRKEEKKQKRKKSVPWKIFKIVLILAIIGALIYGGMFIYKMKKNGGGVQGFIATALGHDENTLKDLDPIRFLVVGISGYEENYKLADTIMVCSYNPRTQKASILSIPRDTYVGKSKANASASYKINAVYRNGKNLDGMIKEIEKITELEIDNYLVVDTVVLRQVVDAIGGVDFDVPIDMDYDDDEQNLHIHLKAGLQHLNGEQAEGVVRFRHNNDSTSYPLEYGDNDVGRMRTQRAFIETALKQVLKPENILKLTKIAEIAFSNIKTNMTFDKLKDYIPYAVNFSTENLQTGALPGVSEKANKVWIYSIDKKGAKEIVEELFGEEEVVEEEENTNTIDNNITEQTTSTPKNKSELKIEVLNGSGKSKNLSTVVNTLKEKGYNIVKSGNTASRDKTTIINRTNQDSSISNDLKDILEMGIITKQSSNSNVDYTIVLGKDYDK